VRFLDQHVSQRQYAIPMYQYIEHFQAREERRKADVEVLGEVRGIVDVPNNIEELRHQKRVHQAKRENRVCVVNGAQIEGRP